MTGPDIATAEDRAPKVPAATTIIAVIERAALDPNVDIDKMERLLQMQERILARQAEMEFNSAMATAQAEMEPVARDRYNDQTRSKYARDEAISKAIKPIISRHGFAPSFGTADCPQADHYRITCRLTHTGGHAENYHADVPIDLTGMKGSTNKTKTHAFGSTMSYGRRYLKLLIFDIATEDDDGNRAGAGPTVSPEQFTKLRDWIEATGSKEAVFLKYFGAQSLEQFPAAKFDAAVTMLEAKKTKGPA